MNIYLLYWGVSIAVAVASILIYSYYRKSNGHRISNYFRHDTLMGAQCSCGLEMRVESPKFILSYEDKKQAENQVQYWITEHKKNLK